MPAYSVGPGWTQFDVPGRLACSSRVSWAAGSNPAVAWATTRSRMPVPQGVVRAARVSSTYAAPALERPRVCWAARRASHAWVSQLITDRQSAGRRWRRSRASATSAVAEVGETRRTSPSSSGVNAATAGVPSPPRVSSGSSTDPSSVAAPVSVVAGWRSAQWAAARSFQASMRRASRSRSRMKASTSSASRSSTSKRSPVTVLMGLAKHRPPTLEVLRTPYPQGIPGDSHRVFETGASAPSSTSGWFRDGRSSALLSGRWFLDGFVNQRVVS